MRKKSFLEKIGLVESTQQEVVAGSLTDEELQAIMAGNTTQNSGGLGLAEHEWEQVDVEISQDQLADLITIETIYEQTNLSDLSTSIFRVDEFSKVLPQELPSDVKKSTVINILSASKLELPDLIDDASKRNSAIKQVLQTFTQETTDVVKSNQDKIAELESQIDTHKKAINERKNLQEQQEDLLEKELDKIVEIVKFLDK